MIAGIKSIIKQNTDSFPIYYDWKKKYFLRMGEVPHPQGVGLPTSTRKLK